MILNFKAKPVPFLLGTLKNNVPLYNITDTFPILGTVKCFYFFEMKDFGGEQGIEIESFFSLSFKTDRLSVVRGASFCRRGLSW